MVEAMLSKLSKLNNIVIHLGFQYRRIISYGILGILKRIVKKSMFFMLSILLFPLSLILWLSGFRRITFFVDRIGHLAIEPDILLKAQVLGIIKPKRWIVLAPDFRVSNSHMLSYWKKYFIVLESSWVCFLMQCLTAWPFVKFDASCFINSSKGTQLGYEVYKRWDDRPPILTLSNEDKEWGAQQLTRLGIPENAWFVCIHAREGGFSPIDESLHSHRNSDIDKLIPAIKEITGRGGWVVRLGDPTMKPLQSMPQVIDYAHHDLRSARLDIILCAQTKFIIGNTSGIFLVSTVFGVPSVLTNMIPMPTLGFLKNDIAMPKLLFDTKKNRYLSFSEVMNSQVATFRYASLYSDNGIVAHENSSEDILTATTEMFERLNNNFNETEQDKLNYENYMSMLKPGHYAYCSASKVSSAFLRRHSDLLNDRF